ncbi:Hypothetical protein DEACI_4182 [Acididesulfobacillus acetoxydans]|uniref:Uncharacterized protein n=1 Tax=Acididesulfobacillus acetoxydans TaxID=1561005 RepID=A0A8S0WAD7_9FIRM|nr:Hypothetical protein DEACI_4182 [Acididesulfobacillus acetoxydans]CEJ09312.1 Hypothetical protein DEACI_3796 [Acididesulfobacillus acetoxydans]
MAYLPSGLEGRLPPTEPESWRLGDAPYGNLSQEIENVLQVHGYSIDTIIVDVMKTFKLKTLCHNVGFKKQDGYSSFQISI